jgi:DUF177 domain-containing protein
MLDIRALRIDPGTVRRVEVPVMHEPVVLGGQTYLPVPAETTAEVELQPTTGALYLKLQFAMGLEGPCMRCLEPARLELELDASEYHDRAAAAEGDEDLTCEYLEADDQLDVARWVHDTLVLDVPGRILCRPDCAGLCPHCGARLQEGDGHACVEAETDTRWEKLKDLL